jgi:hypothetical protein
MVAVNFGISGSDVYSLSNEQRRASELWMMFSVSVNPPNQYLNLKPPRHESFYGYAQLMFGPAVVQTIKLQYANQLIYYSYQCCPEVLDAIACAVKQIASLTEASVTPLNRPFTSVRFRLVPGCFGNLFVSWLPFTSDCGNTINDPPDQQANPPAPNNGPQDPNQQPLESTQDPYDPTGNDGDDPNAPAPENPTGENGTWYARVSFGAPGNDVRYVSGIGKATDIASIVNLGKRTDSPNCTQDHIGLAINGVVVSDTPNCISPILSIQGPIFTYGVIPG